MRVELARQAQQAEKLGGRMISLYYCMGEYDGVVIFEAPDEMTAAAILFTVISPGHLKATKTTVLMSVEETMEAMRKANAEAYPGPSSGHRCPARAPDATHLSEDRVE